MFLCCGGQVNTTRGVLSAHVAHGNALFSTTPLVVLEHMVSSWSPYLGIHGHGTVRRSDTDEVEAYPFIVQFVHRIRQARQHAVAWFRLAGGFVPKFSRWSVCKVPRSVKRVYCQDPVKLCFGHVTKLSTVVPLAAKLSVSER